MSDITNTTGKRKKSRITLDRLVRTIIESLGLLSRHDKQSSRMESNNTVPVPKSKINMISKKKTTVGHGCNVSNYSQVATSRENHIESLVCYQGGQYRAVCMSLPQRPQTWPYDYHSSQIFQEHYPSKIPKQLHKQVLRKNCEDQLLEQFHHENSIELVISTKANSAVRSVKNQEIQTDNTEEFDVNADIIRYLSQLNDNSAFRLHAPNCLEKSGKFIPHYYGHDYHILHDSCAYQECISNRLIHRIPNECIPLERRDYYPYNLIYEPKYDHTPMPCSQQDNRYRYGMSNEVDHQCELGKTRLEPVTLKNCNSLLSHAIDTRVSSGDSGSVLSSETDSDFIFYPCSSLTQTLNRMALNDSRHSSFLSPPPDMPENISTHFSWKSHFYGTSLDEVTLEFFLDDDALSDDVFIDDNDRIYSTADDHYSYKTPADDHYSHQIIADHTHSHQTIADHTHSHQTIADHTHSHQTIADHTHSHQTTAESTYGIDQFKEIFQQNKLGSGEGSTMCRESYGDNCYAYRYADIDEVLNNSDYSSQEKKQHGIPQAIGTTFCPVADINEYIPVISDLSLQCNYDDPGQEFSNVFDSLRRNSTQAKARKMWRQRRAKSKKNLTQDNEFQKSICPPTIFTFDYVSVHNCNQFEPSVRPLRGILKHKKDKALKQHEH